MSALILSIVGFFIGFDRGINMAILGAVAGFCLGRLLMQGQQIISLKHSIELLQNEILALRAPVEQSAAPSAPAVSPSPAPTAATPEPPAPAVAAAVVTPTSMVIDDTWADSVLAEHKVIAPPPALQTPKEAPASTELAPGFNLLAAASKWLFGGNTLVRVGVVVLFFGLAFLIKFAAEHTTVPIEFRYIGIGIAALVTLILGWRLRDKRPDYAMALQGLAIAVFYLTLFAGYRLHNLFPAGLVLALLVATCVLSGALAVLQNTRTLAIVGICGGFLAPVLASSGGGNHVALFSYYALLNAGILGIAWFKAWRPLNVLGFLFTFGIGSLWGNHSYTDALFASTEAFLLLFFFFYLAIALLYAKRRHAEQSDVAAITIRGERIDYVDGTLVFGVPLAAFGLQYLMVRDMPFGSALSALGLGLIYVPLAAWLYRRGQEEARLMVESFLALGVIFISLAIPLALDAQWTSAAWAAEGAGIFWICCRQQRPLGRAFALLLQLGAGIGFLRCLHYPGSEGLFGLQTVLSGPALGAVLVGSAGILIGRLARKYQVGSDSADDLGILWGLFFLNITPLLLLNMQWSALVWAISGASALWIGLRHARQAAPAFGALLQLAAGVAFHDSAHASSDTLMFVNSYYLGILLISAAGFCSGLALARSTYLRPAWLALCWSVLWWTLGGTHEIEQHIDATLVLAVSICFASSSALLLLRLARTLAWTAPRAASLALLPALLLCAAIGIFAQAHPAANYGWLAWPLAGATLMFSLYQQSAVPQRLLSSAHVCTFWLFVLLGISEGAWVFRDLGVSGSAWPILGGALMPLFMLWLVSRPALQLRWPLQDFAAAYRIAAAPIALGIWLWLFSNNLHSTGNAAPLMYLPLLNPLDLMVAAGLLILFGWLRTLPMLAEKNGHLAIAIGLGISVFLWLNGVLLRSLHHWADVPYQFDALMQSTLAQAALSLFWSVLALALMLFATRKTWRSLWLTGGGLMGLVVIKLFLVDLSRVGSVERIVSFIGVGLLLLVIGYFSPVPPKLKEEGA